MSTEIPVWALGAGAVITALLGATLPWALRALRLWLRERREDRAEERSEGQTAAATIYNLLRESRAEVRELGNRLEHATEVATSLRAENAELRAEAKRFAAELAGAREKIGRLEAALERKDVVIAELRKSTVDELVEAVRREAKD